MRILKCQESARAAAVHGTTDNCRGNYTLLTYTFFDEIISRSFSCVSRVSPRQVMAATVGYQPTTPARRKHLVRMSTLYKMYKR